MRPPLGPLSLGFAAALLTACLGREAQIEFFTLSSASGDASGPVLEARPELGLVVGPLELPRYLDRPEIVTRDGAHRLIVADAHLWGGSLATDVLRVLADDLGRLLGTARVVTYPDEPRFRASYRILLDLREFERAGDEVRLRARWTLAAVPEGHAVAVEESVFEQPVASASFEDLVTAQSAVLRLLGRDIASRIAGLPPR